MLNKQFKPKNFNLNYFSKRLYSIAGAKDHVDNTINLLEESAGLDPDALFQIENVVLPRCSPKKYQDKINYQYCWYSWARGSSKNDYIHGFSPDRYKDFPGYASGYDLDGKAGDDFIRGFGGNDDIRGGKGNDIITGGRGSDNIYPGRGDDYIIPGKGRDYIYFNGGDDKVLGFSPKRDSVSFQGGKADFWVKSKDGMTAYYKSGTALFIGSTEDDRHIESSGPFKYWSIDPKGAKGNLSEGGTVLLEGIDLLGLIDLYQNSQTI